MPQLRPRWFKEWRKEYGLSLRKPNRKYKVPKKLLASRFETMILNVARVRAAAEELLGYDPHILNWDQSPFHHNESGTTCTKTLAVKGSIVPLIEGHDDSKARWTANLCVSSDTQDLRENGPPPAEFMFRGGGTTSRPTWRPTSSVKDTPAGCPRRLLRRAPTDWRMLWSS